MTLIKCLVRLGVAFALAAQPAPLLAQGGPIEEGGPMEEQPADAAPQGAPEPAAPAAEEAAPDLPPVIGGEEEEAPAPAPARRGPPKPAIETKVTVRVKEAPLSSFLAAISAQAKVSFVLGKGVETEKITAYLQGVTVREALDVLLETKGLSYTRIGKTNTFVIKAREAKGPPLTTRIYQLNYIPLVEPATGGGGGQQGGAGAATGIAIVDVLQSAMTKDIGKVTLDVRTNSIIVTDVADVFPRVEQLISELDKKVPQVMFEAQIVEIDTDRAQELGIEWGGSKGELISYTGPARQTDWPLRPGIFKGNNLGVFYPPNPSGATPAEGVEDALSSRLITPGVFSMAQVTAVLKALVTRTEARFLGKPKVLTLNNKAASIEITRDQAIGQTTAISGGGSGITSSATTAERRPTGLVLKVTPQVNREGYITVLVEPEFSDIIGSAVSREIFDPIKRKAVTLVRVRNGQTLVLGGLLSSKESKITRKVPFLGYIPVIGWLFTSQSTSRVNTDLVIFITPTVLND